MEDNLIAYSDRIVAINPLLVAKPEYTVSLEVVRCTIVADPECTIAILRSELTVVSDRRYDTLNEYVSGKSVVDNSLGTSDIEWSLEVTNTVGIFGYTIDAVDVSST